MRPSYTEAERPDPFEEEEGTTSNPEGEAAEVSQEVEASQEAEVTGCRVCTIIIMIIVVANKSSFESVLVLEQGFWMCNELLDSP